MPSEKKCNVEDVFFFARGAMKKQSLPNLFGHFLFETLK